MDLELLESSVGEDIAAVMSRTAQRAVRHLKSWITVDYAKLRLKKYFHGGTTDRRFNSRILRRMIYARFARTGNWQFVKMRSILK
jgi:hypothetical protein